MYDISLYPLACKQYWVFNMAQSMHSFNFQVSCIWEASHSIHVGLMVNHYQTNQSLMALKNIIKIYYRALQMDLNS